LIVVVAIPLFEKMTALDAVGPYEVLWRLPDVDVVFVGKEKGTIESERPLGLRVDKTLDEVPAPDVVLVPGGSHTDDMVADKPLVDWVRQAHETSTYTVSVCTGALILGAAGILEGLDATTHWGEDETLEDYGAHYVPKRIVKEGKVITGAGVSAGIDTALRLAAELRGENIAKAIQLLIEYDPEPPFHTGSREDAPPEIKKLAGQLHAYNQGKGPAPASGG
jgi:putative intracellular protease/amidase